MIAKIPNHIEKISKTKYTKEHLESITRDAWLVLLDYEKRVLLCNLYKTLFINTFTRAVDRQGFSKYDEQRAGIFHIALEQMSCAEHILGPSIVFLYRYRKQLLRHGVKYPDCLFEGD
jgi:hypothetical protein